MCGARPPRRYARDGPVSFPVLGTPGEPISDRRQRHYVVSKPDSVLFLML